MLNPVFFPFSRSFHLLSDQFRVERKDVVFEGLIVDEQSFLGLSDVGEEGLANSPVFLTQTFEQEDHWNCREDITVAVLHRFFERRVFLRKS